MTSRLGSIIEGFRDESDPKVILTPSHVARNRAKIRGVLSAISVPTSVASILARYRTVGTVVLRTYSGHFDKDPKPGIRHI